MEREKERKGSVGGQEGRSWKERKQMRRYLAGKKTKYGSGIRREKKRIEE